MTATVAVAMAMAACGNSNGQKTPPETQTATTTNAPMTTTVTGCLRAGDAPDTFTLTAARAAGANDTATYHLVGANGDELRGHVGEEVQVNGTVTTGSEIASSSAPKTEPDRATGTSGTPVVQTQTDLQIRRLQVSSVSPQGQSCPEPQ
jgi:hypothetical protein